MSVRGQATFLVVIQGDDAAVLDVRGVVVHRSAINRIQYDEAMTPIFFDTHTCSLPSTADLISREMDFECRCGRRWRLEHFIGESGALLGPSWILL
jgi:hypothetical protein